MRHSIPRRRVRRYRRKSEVQNHSHNPRSAEARDGLNESSPPRERVLPMGHIGLHNHPSWQVLRVIPLIISQTPRTSASSPPSVVQRTRSEYAAGMYELFEHTADLGLRAEAADLDTLFGEMATALVTAIVEDLAAVRPAIDAVIEIVGEDREYLLFDWLKELLHRFDDEQMLFCRFDVRVRDDGLSATAWGEPFDPDRHALGHEVKAITYHELKGVRVEDGWLAEVIVDI